MAGGARKPRRSCRSAGPMDPRGAQAASAAGCRARYRFERKPDLRPTGRQRRQWAFRLHLLSSAVCVQPAWRLERCALRSGNVHSAASWREMLEPVVARYRGTEKRCCFRGDAAFANSEIYEFLDAEAMVMRSGYRPIGCCKTRSATSSSARSGDRRRRCAATVPAFATMPAHDKAPTARITGF
jgi:hypothetical protein